MREGASCRFRERAGESQKCRRETKGLFRKRVFLANVRERGNRALVIVL